MNTPAVATGRRTFPIRICEIRVLCVACVCSVGFREYRVIVFNINIHIWRECSPTSLPVLCENAR